MNGCTSCGLAAYSTCVDAVDAIPRACEPTSPPQATQTYYEVAYAADMGLDKPCFLVTNYLGTPSARSQPAMLSTTTVDGKPRVATSAAVHAEGAAVGAHGAAVPGGRSEQR
jgi:hypothetical protein